MMKVHTLLVGAALVLVSCKKEPAPAPEPSTPATDNVAPVLTLKGKQKDTVFLQTTYNDAGATAIDNKDGDISPFIVVSGTINTGIVGDYMKEYNVRDAAGNAAKAIRNIRVRNESEYLNGKYLVACNCTTANPGVDPDISSSVTYTVSLATSAAVNNYFSISKIVVGTGTDAANPGISLSGTGLSGNFSQSGFANGMLSGTVTPSSNSFTLGSFLYNVSYPNKTYKCTNVFSKQ
jgi:hypothetical protein